MAEKTLFRVTDTAGPYVAGRKVKAGAILELTAGQASYELLLGSIAPYSDAPTLRTPEDGGSVDLVFREGIGGGGGGGRRKR